MKLRVRLAKNIATLGSCKETVGVEKRKHQDWFNENEPEIQALLEKSVRRLWHGSKILEFATAKRS